MAVIDRGPTNPPLPHSASGCLVLLSLLQIWRLLNPRLRQFRNLDQQKANSVEGWGGKGEKYRTKKLSELFIWESNKQQLWCQRGEDCIPLNRATEGLIYTDSEHFQGR